MVRTKRRRLAIAGAAIFIVIFIIVLLAHTPGVSRYALGRLQGYLRSEYGIELNAGRLRPNLLRLTLMLEKVSLSSAATPDLPPFVQIERAHLRFGLMGLLRGPLAVQDGRLEGVKIVVLTEPTGRTNLPSSPSQQPFSELPDFLLDSVEIANASFLFEDRRHDVLVDLPRLSARIDGNAVTLNHDLDLRLSEQGHALYQDRFLTVDRLGLTAEVRKKDLILETLEFNSSKTRISGSGSIKNFADPALHFNLQTTLDLADINRLAGFKEELEGTVSAQAALSGTLKEIKISGQLEGTDVAAAGYRQISLEAHGGWNSRTQRLRVEQIAAQSPQGSAQGVADLSLDKGGGPSSIQAKVEALELQGLTRLLRLPVLLASRLSGDIVAKWRGSDYSRLYGDSRVRLKASRTLPVKELLPVTASLLIKFGDERIQTQIESASLLASKVRGRVSLKSMKSIEGEVRGSVDNLGDLLSQLPLFLGRNERLIDLELAGGANFTATLRGPLENPMITASVEAPRLRIGDLSEVDAKVVAEINRSLIKLMDASASVAGQTLHAQGEIGLGGAGAPINLNLWVDQASIASVLSAFKVEIPADGTFQASTRLTGKLNDLQGDLQVSAADLKLYGEPLGSLSGEARVAGTRIETTRLALDKTPGDNVQDLVEAKLALDFQSGQYSLTAEGKDLRLEQLSLPGEIPVRGKVSLSASGEGTLNNPNLTLNLDVADLTLRDQVVGPVKASATLTGRDAVIEARAPRLALTSNAEIRVEPPYPLRLKTEADKTDLGLLGIVVGDEQRLNGNLDATFNASGDLNDWKAGTANAQIRDLRLSLLDREIRNSGIIALDYQNGLLDIQPSVLIAKEGEVRIAGSMPIDTRDEGNLGIKARVDLGQVFPFLPATPGLYASGDLNLDIVVSGTLQQIKATGPISVANGFFHHPAIQMPFTDVGLNANLDAGSLVIKQATAVWASGKVDLSGEFPLGLLPENFPVKFERKNAPARLSASIQGLQLESTGELPGGFTGVVSLHAVADAPRLDPAEVSAKIVFDQLQLQLEQYIVQQAEPATISVRDGLARIENFRLTGPETRIEMKGTAGLQPDQPLDIRLDGDLDAAILTFMSEDLRAAGRTQLGLDLKGTLGAPEIAGFAQLEDGQLSLAVPRIAADGLNIRLSLTRDRIAIENCSGNLNGGALRAKGSVGYTGSELNDFNIDVSLESVFLNFPEGLKTLTDADLRVRSTGHFIVIGGSASVLEGSFRDPLEIEGELLNYLRAEQVVDLGQEPSPFLSRIRYNIALSTQGPVIVDNNLAKLVAEANLRLVGSYHRPSVIGRLSLEEGGEIYLSEKNYIIERGIIDLNNQSQIEPNLDIQATTQAGGYDVTLSISGPPKNIDTTLTSDPPLPEPDIMSLLITGRTLEDFRGEELDVAKEQALSYLAGRAGQRISGGAERALGLSRVRIEPHLISAESDPSARLTVGQDITNRLRFVYSMNLTDSGDQIWISEYDLSRRFSTRGIKQSDNSYRMEFQHDLRFGAPSDAAKQNRAARSEKEIGSIGFTGSPAFSQKILSDKLNYKTGDKYDFFKLQKKVDRLQGFYTDKSRLEARIRLNRETKDDIVDLNFKIDSGPQLEFAFEGFDIPGDVRQEVRGVWKDGVFDAQRAEEAIRAIKKFLVKGDYFQSTVEYAIQSEADRKKIRFLISPGTRFKDVVLAFEGVTEIGTEELENELERADLKLAIYTEPRRIIDFLTRYYQRNGYLAVKIDQPRLELDAGTGSGKVILPIKEGPLFKIGGLDFVGNDSFEDAKLKDAIALSAGGSYKPELVTRSVDELERFYWKNGYNDVEINYRIAQDSTAGVANLSFEIVENRKGVVQEVVVEGTTRTSVDFVRRQVGIDAGEVLDFEKVNRARKSLYEAGVYTVVDLEAEEIPQNPAKEGIKPVRLRVKLKEVQPYRFRYGAFFDTERGPGFIADAAHRNLLGKAAILGLRTRYDSDLKEARLYFSQPQTRGIPLKSDATGFLRREIRETFITDRLGFSLQQEKRLKNSFLFNYGYRFERAHTFDKEPDPLFPFDVTLPVARLVGTLTRDTRDHLLDASQGSFTSHALEFAPKKLGSDIRFIKYYGQYFHYRPLGDANVLQPGEQSRFIYAGGVRMGLAKGLGGQDVVPSERFFAGGGTTLRGFQQDKVGPLDSQGDPLGGEAVFLVNNEVRFPLFSIFDGVGFLDLGNVYSRVSDLNPFDIRKAAGFGIRVRTGFMLLRFDLGVKLDRKPGESLTGFFFSIGQAF